MNEPIMIRQLGDASAADITDDAVAVVSVEDEAAATGYTTKKSLLRRIKDYIIGNTSITGSGKSDVTSLLGGTSIAGVSDGTVTGAIADNATLVGDTSISGVGDGTVTGAISSLNSDLTNRTGYTYINVPKDSSFGAGTFNCIVFQYYKSAIVYLNVGLPSIAANTETLMCTLPVGSRPSTKFNMVVVTQSSTPIVLLLQWYMDGRITVYPLSAVNGQFLRGTFAIPTA